jgi:hypothetical protein
MLTALQDSAGTLSKFTQEDQDKFEKYVLDLCHMTANHSAEEVLSAIRGLYMYWAA